MTLKIPHSIYEKIMATIGSHPAETGGVMAMEDDRITDFYFDYSAETGASFYRPNLACVNAVVNKWLQEGLQLCGFIHSHRSPYTELSALDKVAAEMTMAKNNLPSLFMGLVVEKQLYFFQLVHRKGEKHSALKTCSLTLIDG
jgi:hypothetical protein